MIGVIRYHSPKTTSNPQCSAHGHLHSRERLTQFMRGRILVGPHQNAFSAVGNTTGVTAPILLSPNSIRTTLTTQYGRIAVPPINKMGRKKKLYMCGGAASESDESASAERLTFAWHD